MTNDKMKVFLSILNSVACDHWCCIQDYDCLKYGPPPVDEPIRVLWTDGKIYCAVFRGTRTIPVYLVRDHFAFYLGIPNSFFFNDAIDYGNRFHLRMSPNVGLKEKSFLQLIKNCQKKFSQSW